MKKSIGFIFSLLIVFSSFGQLIPNEGLPVSVQTLDIAKQGSDIKLNWKVACFIEKANFEIQRSSDGVQYETIHSFQADKTRCSQPFNYEDHNVTGKQFYRVRVGNADGQFFSSKIVSITGANKGYNINSFLPTIVSTTAAINISSASADKTLLKISNFHGNLLYVKQVMLEKGNNEIRLDLSALPFGNYILNSINGEGEIRTIRFVKQ